MAGNKPLGVQKHVLNPLIIFRSDFERFSENRFFWIFGSRKKNFLGYIYSKSADFGQKYAKNVLKSVFQPLKISRKKWATLGRASSQPTVKCVYTPHFPKKLKKVPFHV